MMMTQTTTNSAPGSERLKHESGGWITCRVPRPEMDMAPIELLAASAQPQSGNLRYAIDGGHVYRLGELRDPEGLMSLAKAQVRLFATAGDQPHEVPPADVAGALGETGYEWSQPQDDRKQWRAVVNDARCGRCDLTATIIPGGVQVRSLPAAWQTELTAASQSALVQFLAAAQGRIRFARFLWQDCQATAVSFAAADRLDVELPDSVAAVLAACRLVGREVSALANVALAEAYLQSMT